MADAALSLCTSEPAAMTGRIGYSMDLLGRPMAEGPWALADTF
jgi:hypothetical protein